VVSTTIGAEGLGAVDGEHLLLADTPERFAGAVSALLDSADVRKRLGRAGRRLYEERFIWESAWASLTEAGL
jgi:glycosyltransferase involved in cell wall biosynthesis